MAVIESFSSVRHYMHWNKLETVNPALVKVDSRPRWTNDPPNQVKIGMGLIKYIECDNERDK